MSKLSIEQLLEAYSIGASHYETYADPEVEYYKTGGEGYMFYNLATGAWCEGVAIFFTEQRINDNTKIDFSPLYEWMEWSGGDCPVVGDVLVDYTPRLHYPRGFDTASAKGLRWSHTGGEGDIVTWKLHKGESATETPTNELPEINKWYHCSDFDEEAYLVGYYQDWAVIREVESEGGGYYHVPPNSLTPIKTDKDKFIEQVNEKLNLEDVMFKDVVEFIWDSGYGKLPD